jgi:serine/threonine protein kinase
MGEVYWARDTRLERFVAIKIQQSHLSCSPELKARFEREARTLSTLSHPHICSLYDVGKDGDVEFLVMELLEGETLSTAERSSVGECGGETERRGRRRADEGAPRRRDSSRSQTVEHHADGEGR